MQLIAKLHWPHLIEVVKETCKQSIAHFIASCSGGPGFHCCSVKHRCSATSQTIESVVAAGRLRTNSSLDCRPSQIQEACALHSARDPISLTSGTDHLAMFLHGAACGALHRQHDKARIFSISAFCFWSLLHPSDVLWALEWVVFTTRSA